MRMYIAIFVASIGSVAAFNGRLPLYADKVESVRSKVDAIFNSNISSNYDITEEATATSITRCIKTEKALRDAVQKAVTGGPKYTRINLCTKNLLMSGKIDLSGIDLSNKWLDIRCSLTKKEHCAINGQGLSGFLYGTEANIKIDRVDFVQGDSDFCPMIFRDSNIQLSHSSFQKNVAYFIFIMVGGNLLKFTDVAFVQNYAVYYDIVIDEVTRSTISSSSFKSNNDNYGWATLVVSNGAYLELSDVTFEDISSVTTDEGTIVNIENVDEVKISGTLFKNNEANPLILYRGVNALIANSSFEGNYNTGELSSAVIAAYTNVTLNGVNFFNNILIKNGGNAIGSLYSRVKLLGCTFANNHGPDPHIQNRSTDSSTVRVYDGDHEYDDPIGLRKNSTLFCSATKFCDGFPSDETIVDQFFKPFDAPTCTAFLNC